MNFNTVNLGGEPMITKVYKRRPLSGLRAPSDPAWVDLGDPEAGPLSEILEMTRSDRIYLCGSVQQMSREYVEEPLANGWEFARKYVHKFRSPVYRESLAGEYATPEEAKARKQISVKLISESWFPGCKSALEAIAAWRALKAEWESTGLPLLTTPAATGRALLWESLPFKGGFPALPDDLAKHYRRHSPQHRREIFTQRNREHINSLAWEVKDDVAIGVPIYQYDGRFMYAALCLVDRLPIGEARYSEYRKAGVQYVPYIPGLYQVEVTIPQTWAHIGLVPVASEDGGWSYPNEPGMRFQTCAHEPELTLAQENGWNVRVYSSYAFIKDRPLENWAKKLIAMRDALNKRYDAIVGDVPDPGREVIHYKHAAAAIRNILNHTIGSLQAGGYEREVFVSDPKGDKSSPEFREWWTGNREYVARGGEWGERVEGGWLVRSIVPDNSPMSITMPHWSATIWALERARVAQWALK